MNLKSGKNGLKSRNKHIIPIRWFVLGNTMLGLFVLLFSYIEITQTRDDLKQTAVGEGKSLLYTISNSVNLAMKAANQSEDNLHYRLNAMKELILLTNSTYLAQADEFGIDSVFIADAEGHLPDSTWITDEFDEQMQWHLFRSGDRVVHLGLCRAKLLEYRRNVGIGKIMRDLSANKDIVYCVLQDTIGIVAASENILELSRINHDEMLRATWLDSNFRHREFSFDGTEVIESFTTISTVQGKFLLRLALSTEKSMNIYSRAVNRTVLIAVGLFISGFIMINFIISRRKILSLEEQHDNLQNHLDLIMSNITDAVIVLNSDFTFRFFNNAAKELLAIENKNCVGEKYSSVFPDDIFQIKSVEYPGGKSRLNEITLKLGNQEKHIVYSVSLLSYRNENQNIIIIIKDMTDIRALRERLRQQDKMTAIGQLAAGVAHEIRNPLSAVNIIAQRFELEFIPENDKEEYMQLTGTVRNEIGRVNEIIKQFLEFAKPTAIHRNKRNIADLLNNIVNLIKPLCDKGAIEIETDLNSIEAEIDSDKMTQAILNLCNNAIEAMPEGGRLTLSSSLQNDSAIIQIEDTGIGIPEEHKNKIFNLYFSTKQHGTGLGLSIVYQIVSEHGGDIKVESAPHSGTKFIINLPM